MESADLLQQTMTATRPDQPLALGLLRLDGPAADADLARLLAGPLLHTLRGRALVSRPDDRTLMLLFWEETTMAQAHLAQSLAAVRAEAALPPCSTAVVDARAFDDARRALHAAVEALPAPPPAPPEEAAPPARPGSRDHARTAAAPARPRVALLAEADPYAARLIAHRLERRGWQTHHVEHGARAVSAAAAQTPALILLDVKMPGLNGFEILRRLRQGPAHRATPVVMLASVNNEQDIVRAFALGADDYVLKPFSPVELMARITRLVPDGPA